jgi:hypothetical protein
METAMEVATAGARLKVLEIPAEELDERALTALAERRLAIIHVKEFVAPQVCALIAERAEGYGYSPYLNVPSVRRIGMAFYETEGRADLVDQYFSIARKNLLDFRRACEPYSSPIDVLRCFLD